MKRWLLVIALAGVMVGGLFASRNAWLAAAGHWLDVGQPPQPTDYCLVLAGDLYSRPFAAAVLYRHGFVRKQIWLTRAGMIDSESLQPADGVAAATRILVAVGVPRENVAALDGLCKSTFDEAESLARAMHEHSDASVTVVTSNYHTRRARWIIQRVLGPDAGRVRFVSAPTDYFDADCWWKTEEGVATYTKEFAKLPFYWIWYGWGGIWLLVLAVALGAVGIWIWRRMFRRHADGANPPRPRPLSRKEERGERAAGA